MNICNAATNGHVYVTTNSGTSYTIQPGQSLMVNESGFASSSPYATADVKPKISLKDTAFLHRITQHDQEAKEVIQKMLPFFQLEV